MRLGSHSVAGVLASHAQGPGFGPQDCTPVIPGYRKWRQKKSEVQVHPWLQTEFEPSLDCLSSCLKTNKRNRTCPKKKRKKTSNNNKEQNKKGRKPSLEGVTKCQLLQALLSTATLIRDKRLPWGWDCLCTSVVMCIM